MLIIKACPIGPLDNYKALLHRLSVEFVDRWGILALADETNRREEWPIYRARIERAVKAGNPPEFWNPSMPWASVITMAVEDDKFWNLHFVKPCERNIRAEDAAAAAARARSGYIPAMQNDGLDDMLRGINATGVAGPYEGRAAPRGTPGAGHQVVRYEQQYTQPPPLGTGRKSQDGSRARMPQLVGSEPGRSFLPQPGGKKTFTNST